MSDLEDRGDQILAIARVLAQIPTGNPSRPYVGVPAPSLPIWAQELYDDFGVRVHPELATHELVRVKSAMGNNGPVQKVTKGTPARVGDDNPVVERMKGLREELMDWMRQMQPDLAARYEAAGTDPEAHAILLNDIVKHYPDVKAKSEELLARINANPEAATT